MIEAEVLADRLRTAGVLVESEGRVAWQRVDDWHVLNPPAFREPLDDDQDARVRAGRSEAEEERRKGEAAAARYKPELATLTKRLTADLARLTTIISICCPPNPRDLATLDKLQAQIESEGFCGLCWRADQEPVEAAKGRYRGRCTWCGERRADFGFDPPLWLVRKHLAAGPGGRLTTADLEKARKGGKAA